MVVPNTIEIPSAPSSGGSSVVVDATGATTDGFVTVTGFPLTNSDGMMGIGTILNTGANGMNVRETVTDKFGNTQSVTTVVAAGDDYMLDLQTNFGGAAFPPYTDYTVEVQSQVAGNPTSYELHFLSPSGGTGGGGGGDWLYDGNIVVTEKSIGTLDNVDFPFISRGNEGARLHNTVDSDAVTQLVNFLIGRTTQSVIVEPFDYKLPLDILRDHNQSTYALITNTVNDTHSVAGWVAQSVASSQVIVSIMAPNALFADMRAGGAAALQVSGATEVVIFSEDNVPIRIGVADTEVARFNSTGMAFPGTLVGQTLITGFIVFNDRINTSDSIFLNNLTDLTGVGSPDGGAPSARIEGSHIIVGFGTNDVTTGRGLIAEKSDGTAIGELFFYHNGTPIVQTYIGGFTGGNIASDYRFDAGTVKISFYPGGTSVAQQTVTGSLGGNAALASLVTAIANLNLIVDGTSP